MLGAADFWLNGWGAAYPKVSTLVDDFTTADSTKWTFGPNATVANGQLSLAATANYDGVATSRGSYDLTASSAYVQVPQITNLGTGTTDTEFHLEAADGSELVFVAEGGILYAQAYIGSNTNRVYQATASYNATNHKWWRISESGGVITWATSPDAVTWTTFTTWTNAGFPATAVRVVFITGYWGTETAPGTGVFDNLNVPPASAYSPSTASFPNPERGPFYYSETHYQGGGTGITQTDSFTGTNGAAPSATNWTVSNSTGSTATVQNNALQLVTGTAGGYNDVARLTSTMDAASDVHLTFDVTPGTSTESYFDVMLRAAGSGGSLGQSGYKFEVGSWGGISLSKVTGYSATALNGGVTPSIAGYAVGTVVHVDIQTSGSTLTFSAWTGATKPSTPMISVTDTTYTAAGNVGFYLNGGNVGAANTWTLDNWSATTGSGGGSPTGHVPLSGSAVASAVASGQSQVFRYCYMETYNSVGSTIDSTYLALLDADLATVRANGAKIILRFAYSSTDIETYPYGNPDPGPTTSVAHIQQLAPTLNKYADVIEAVEAGFIGIWGEWYYTANYTSGTNPAAALTAQNWADRRSILTALLSNLDARIFVLVRYAGVKPNYFQQATIPADSTNAGYWQRMGYHDDAEGASTDDWGTFSTFPWPGWTSLPADAQSFVQIDVQTYALPWGGEVASNTVTYSAFKAEMQRYRANFWNPSDFGGSQATQGWTAANLTEVGQSLGYRLRLVSASLPTSGTAGNSATVSLVIANDGWSTVLRNRPVVVDFVNGATVVSSTLAADPRTWAPGAQTTVTGTVTLPATAGTWTMHLRFPDPSANLAGNAAYCIQLANTGVWDATTGRNALGQSVVVSTTSATPATATGGITLGGSTTAASAAPAATGGITLGGSTTAAAAAPATSGSITLGGSTTAAAAAPATSGSITLGGSATAQTAATAAATGSVSLSGSSSPAAGATAGGGITLGAAGAARGSSAASGTVSLGGSATVQAQAAVTGSVSLSGSSSPAATAAAGGGITLGAAGAARGSSAASGTVSLGGSGSANSQGSSTAVGTVSLGGSAAAAVRATAAGGVTLAGSTSTSAAQSSIVGGITVGGSAVGRAPVSSAGGVTLGGTASAGTQRPATATGGITLGGSAAATGDTYHPHTYVRATLLSVIGQATLVGAGVRGATLTSVSTQGAAVTALTLDTPYPSDDLYPSDSLFPDSTYLPAQLSAVLVEKLGDAQLTTTSSGGASLITESVAAAAIQTT